MEWRICRELAGMAAGRIRNFWCDGITPRAYFLATPTPRIVGTAWIGQSPNTDEWEFTLFIPSAVESLDEIDWAALLPADNVTNWLAFDPDSKRLQIEPAAAVPDLL